MITLRKHTMKEDVQKKATTKNSSIFKPESSSTPVDTASDLIQGIVRIAHAHASLVDRRQAVLDLLPKFLEQDSRPGHGATVTSLARKFNPLRCLRQVIARIKWWSFAEWDSTPKPRDCFEDRFGTA